MKYFFVFSFLFPCYMLIAQQFIDVGATDNQRIANFGKIDSTNRMLHVFEKDTLSRTVAVQNYVKLNSALKSNLTFLKNNGNKTASSLKDITYSYKDIRNVNELLLQIESNTIDLSNFQLQKICGDDSLGNVLYTSYYIPIISVSKYQDSVFKYPLYKNPNSSSLQSYTRSEIDIDRKLNGRNLEIAYAKNYFDVFSMQVQGSGYIEYQDGSQRLLSYAGKNNRPYYSIGQYMIEQDFIQKEDISMQSIKSWFESNPDSINLLMKNSSYVFFRESYAKPTGAAGLSLTEDVSIAGDFKYLPKGAIVLGEIPVLNSKGKLIQHEYRVLIVQDTGGAIKGPGHIDIFAGIGPIAGEYAGKMKYFGRLWLILPNK